MESLSSKDKSVKYLLRVIDVFAKYAWVNILKDKKGKTVLNAFIEIANESNHKPNKLWVDQGRELYNKLMQEWLDNNDILIYSTHNEGKSVIAERFIKTLKYKICKRMTVNDSKSFFPYFNKLVDQYNNTYIILLIRNHLMAIIVLQLKILSQILKLPNLKQMIVSGSLSIRIYLVKVILKIGQKKYLLSIMFWKLILGHIKLEIWTEKKCSYEKELLWSYYPETDSHNREKVKVVLDLSNYATKKELDHATGVDLIQLLKKDFIGLRTEKLDINKLVNVSTSLNNLKTKIADLDVSKLKAVPINLKKLSDIVDNNVVMNTKFNTLKTKINSLEKKITMQLH